METGTALGVPSREGEPPTPALLVQLTDNLSVTLSGRVWLLTGILSLDRVAGWVGGLAREDHGAVRAHQTAINRVAVQFERTSTDETRSANCV